MRLYAWTVPDTRGPSALVAEIEWTGPSGQLLNCRDPKLAEAFSELTRAPHLPLTVRRLVGASRHVSCERLSPSDADYWRALAEGLSRRTGHLVTDSAQPPT